jgi:RNA polymerase primary sigma factor
VSLLASPRLLLDRWWAFPAPTADARGTLGDFVEDDRVSDTLDAVLRVVEIAQLREAIERLPERPRYVLVRRYGLDDREPATLAELGDELDISRERVRQMQQEAERIVRNRCSGRVRR